MFQVSAWTYKIAASGGVGLGKLLVSGGMFVLEDPQERLHRFAYQGLGLSLGERKLLPKQLRLPEIALPKILMKNGSLTAGGATTNFDGGGIVLYSGKREPGPEDFQGYTLYSEFNAGVLVGYGFSAFVAGMRKEMIVPFMFAPSIFSDYLFTSSAPIILFNGMSEGLIESVGLGLSFGTITYDGPYDG
jgi:hypothetical protein